MRPAEAAAAIRGGVKKKLSRDRRAILEAALFGAEVIAKHAPVDVGSLKSSVHVQRDPLTGDPSIVVDAPHASTVELGSRPHLAPLGPLIAWVNRHRALFGLGKAPRRRRGAEPTVDPEVMRIALAIQHKIAQHGTKPTFFVRNSLPEIVAGLARFIGEAQSK